MNVGCIHITHTQSYKLECGRCMYVDKYVIAYTSGNLWIVFVIGSLLNYFWEWVVMGIYYTNKYEFASIYE